MDVDEGMRNKALSSLFSDRKKLIFGGSSSLFLDRNGACSSRISECCVVLDAVIVSAGSEFSAIGVQ